MRYQKGAISFSDARNHQEAAVSKSDLNMVEVNYKLVEAVHSKLVSAAHSRDVLSRKKVHPSVEAVERVLTLIFK